MKYIEEQRDGIQEAVRRALAEELPKVLESFIARLTDKGGGGKTPELISRRQTAEILGVSLQTVAILISSGTLQSVRVRRRVLVPVTAVVQYLETHASTDRTGGR